MTEEALTITMQLAGQSSRYQMGQTALQHLGEAIGGVPAAALIDAQVSTHHAARIKSALATPGLPTFVVPGGEGVKTLANLDQVFRWLAAIRLPRDGVLVGIGGGAVLDLTGLAASLWQRGIGFVAVPTTLLAMVDAAIGGKTAVNAAGLKNPVGSFHPARQILAEVPLLATLPRACWQDGLAETIKTAIIGDAELLASLYAQRAVIAQHLATGDPEADLPELVTALAWPEWIGRAARVKCELVVQDFKEAGPRQALNLGHTLGHALEAHSASSEQPLSHGAAVAIGMAVVSRIAAERRLYPQAAAEHLGELLTACGLPQRWPAPPRDELERLLAGDKKRRSAELSWVLPAGEMGVQLDQRVGVDELLAQLDQPTS